MRKLVIGGWVALGACVAWYGANGSAAAQEAGGSRNAFVEVTAPPGLAVRWISGEDFVLVGKDGRPGRGRVTVRARPGWKLTEPKDGVMELAPGKAVVYAVAGLLGEDEGGGDGHTCDNSESVVTNHVSAPVISLTNVTAQADRILLPPEVTNATVAISTEVLVVSNGVHESITTINPCTVCGEPEKSVTTNTVDCTPSSFVWTWKIGSAGGGTVVGGRSFSTNVVVKSLGKYPVEITAVATNTPECCACSASGSTNVLVMLLDHKTAAIAAANPNPRRTKLGVGEHVTLFILPASETGTWTYRLSTATNPLNRVSKSGNTLEYEALRYVEIDGTGTTVTFEHENGLSAEVGFNVMAPAGAVARNPFYPNPDFHGWQNAGAIMYLSIFLMPDDVSFYRLEVWEVAKVSIDATGYFTTPAFNSNWLDHGKYGAGIWGNVAEDNRWEGVDEVNSGKYARPWVKGAYSWPIPAQWKFIEDDDSDPCDLPWSDQLFSIEENGFVMVTKFGYTVWRYISGNQGISP